MLTDRSTTLVAFLFRILWPLVAFVLFLSIGLNAFFLTVDRFRQAKEVSRVVPPASTTGAVIQEYERGPKAFGVVRRGFEVMPQTPPVGVEFPPVLSYDIPSNLFPELPATLTLFRDQGVTLDTSLLHTVFQRLGAPYNAGSMQYFAKFLNFRSSDRSMEISIDVEKRKLTMKKLGLLPPPPSTSRADDVECIALAKDFVETIGFDHLLQGDPTVVDRIDVDGSAKTFVVWAATIDSFPLFDLSLKRVPKIEVQVGRVSKRAIQATVNLFEAGLLARSAYTVASKDVLMQKLQSGGYLPLARAGKAKAASVAYSSLSLAYLLYPADLTQPTYLLPILKADWSMDPSCAGCVPVRFATFTPALDPSVFTWDAGTQAAIVPLATPLSASSLSSVSSLPSSAAFVSSKPAEKILPVLSSSSSSAASRKSESAPASVSSSQ